MLLSLNLAWSMEYFFFSLVVKFVFDDKGSCLAQRIQPTLVIFLL